MNSKVIAVFLALAGAILFSAKAIFARYAYQISDIDHTNLLFLRMAFAAPFYVFVFIRTSRNATHTLSNKEWGYLLLLGLLGYYLAAVFDFWGLEYLEASLERIILFIYPSFVVLLNLLIYRISISKTQILAIMITYAGILAIFYHKVQLPGADSTVKGAMLIVLCALSYAFFVVGSGNLIPKIGSKRFTAIALLISAVMIFIHSGVSGKMNFWEYDGMVYFIAFLMAVFSTVIPSFLISEAVGRIGANVTSILASIGPVSTIIMGTLFLDETVDRYQIIGTIIVIFGIFIITQEKKKHEKA